MKLKFGMVGGGNGAFIGAFHRQGAVMDDLAELTAGCFSRRWDKNLECAETWGVRDSARVYHDYEEMARAEGARADGIDFVSIVTPNSTHYPAAKAFLSQGIHVVCDKPLTMTVAEAEELRQLAQDRGLLFAVTYTYAGYAIIRQAREMVEAGAIGKLLHVRAEFPQEWFIVSKEAGVNEQAAWRLDKSQAGESGCTADMCTHIEHLVAAMCGLHPERVLAQFDFCLGHTLENNVNVLVKYPGGATGTLWASQIATGHELDLSVELFGEKGSLRWKHGDSNAVWYTPVDQPPQYITLGRRYTCPESRRLMRGIPGAPVGYAEAFGNIYRSFMQALLARKAGEEDNSYTYPTVTDGVWGMKFINACLQSHREGNVWVGLG
ncbi:MAG: Gfo/Idh/MocA family protein [Intestinibacillus sp.]